MQLESEFEQDALVLRPIGRLDSNTAQEFEQRLLEQINGNHKIVLDLAGLDYVSSAGLRVLLIAAKQIRQSTGVMALCAAQEPIRQVFEISGFLSILTVCDSRAEALSRVSA